MATKKKPTPKVRERKPSFDLSERAAFIAAVVLIALGLVIHFRAFLFSGGTMIIGSDFYQAGFVVKSFLKAHVGIGNVEAHWNPLIFGGIPYIEAFYSDIFYPLSLLFREFGDLWRMLSYNLVLHFFLAAFFMYSCARQFGLSKLPSLFAAASYSFAPYFMSLLAPYHDGKIFVTTFFPLMFFFLERGFQSVGFLRQLVYFSLFGGAIGFAALAPHIQMTYFSLLALFLYTIFRLVTIWRDSKSISRVGMSGTLTAWGVAVGLGLAAIQLYPGVIYTQTFSPRADTKKGWDWATSWSMHEEEVMSLFVPEFAGVSTDKAKTYYWGKNAFKDNSESAGIVPFALAIVALFFVRRREAYFFMGLALFALLYALGSTTPVFYLFYHLIPNVESLRAPSMIMFIFSFSVALLAAMGIQFWSDNRGASPEKARKLRKVVLVVIAFFFVFAFLFTVAGRGMMDLWTSIFFDTIGEIQIQQGVTKLDVAYANLGAIKSGAWIGFLLVTIALLSLFRLAGGSMGVLVVIVLIGLTIIDGLRFNGRFLDVIDPTPLTVDTPLTMALNALPSESRVLDLSSQRGPQDGLLPQHEIPIPGGYHGNQLRWYDDLLGGIGMPNISEPRLLNLASVEYLVLPSGQSLPDNYFGGLPLRPVQSIGSQQIVRNENALPKTFVVGNYEVFAERAQIYPRILNGNDSLKAVAFLEERPTFEAHSLTAADSSWIIHYGLDSVTIGVSASSPCLVILTDNWFDAWQATVDGQPSKIFRAYGTFRAVEVGAGSREVVFTFDSPRYAFGKTVTLVTSIYLILLVAGFVVVDRRRKAL